MMRNMESGKQSEVSQEEIIKEIKQRLKED